MNLTGAIASIALYLTNILFPFFSLFRSNMSQDIPHFFSSLFPVLFIIHIVRERETSQWIWLIYTAQNFNMIRTKKRHRTYGTHYCTYCLLFLPRLHGRFVFFKLVTPVRVNFLIVIAFVRWCTSGWNAILNCEGSEGGRKKRKIEKKNYIYVCIEIQLFLLQIFLLSCPMHL